MKKFLFFIFLSATSILFSTSGFLYSQQPDSLKIEPNVTTLKQDSTIKDTAKVDEEEYHIIAVGGIGFDLPHYNGFSFSLNLGIEFPFSKKNYFSFSIQNYYFFIQTSNMFYIDIISETININLPFSNKLFMSCHLGLCQSLGVGGGLDIGKSFTYKLNKSISLSIDGRLLIIWNCSGAALISTNIKYNL